MEKSKKIRRNPWAFVPTQYFAEGVPFVLVNQLSVALYKSLNASNSFIGFTSFLYLPWAIKLFWGPFVDLTSTKRAWVLRTQLILGIAFAILALALNLGSFLTVSLIIFTIIAFISATHDIATDGFYLHSLDKKEQAFFTGIRSTFYRIAMIFSGGVLVAAAGYIGSKTGNVKIGWTSAFALSSAIFIILFFYHKFILPYPITDVSVINSDNRIPFGKIFKEYFTQKKIGAILCFILLFRFGEGLLLKMVQPFFLDKPEAGGLNLSLSEVGIMYGTLGVVALLIGGILGGWTIKKYGLRKLILPLALIMHLPILLFIYLAAARPEFIITLDFSWLSGFFGSDTGLLLRTHPITQLCIIIEQFGYGFGFSAYTVYLLYISKGVYKTSHYAISTGLMAFGMMVPGFLSGIIQSYAGYTGLFIISLLMTIPGIISIFFLPYENVETEEQKLKK